ncbi:hypothetical protein ABPG72_020076 [Tetrahymena utriculariae]
MEQQKNDPSSQSSSNSLNQSSTPIISTKQIPPKVKTNTINQQEIKEKRKMSKYDEILNREYDNHNQIQELNLQIDNLIKTQEQIQKEMSLLLSATNSSNSSSKIVNTE